MKILKITLLVSLTTLILFGCSNDSKDPKPTPASLETTPARELIQPDKLVGNWILTEATIDRVPTNRLDSAYFEFGEDKVLKTNVMGSPEEGTYTFEGKILTQNTAKTIEYHVEKLVEDSLVMNMVVSRKNFRVLLQR